MKSHLSITLRLAFSQRYFRMCIYTFPRPILLYLKKIFELIFKGRKELEEEMIRKIARKVLCVINVN